AAFVNVSLACWEFLAKDYTVIGYKLLLLKANTGHEVGAAPAAHRFIDNHASGNGMTRARLRLVTTRQNECRHSRRQCTNHDLELNDLGKSRPSPRRGHSDDRPYS